MPLKKRKASGQPPAKRAKRVPLDCDAAWGYLSDDVAAAVEWPTLQKSFDELTAPTLWANKLTHKSFVEKVPFAVRGGARLRLLDAIAGETAKASKEASDSTSSSQQPMFVVSSSVALQKAEGKGRGWFARKALKAGSMVLVERPLVATLDVQWRDKNWADCASADTVALGLELAKAYSASVGAALAQFHPLEGSESTSSASHLQDEDEEEDDPEALAALQSAISGAWEGVADISESSKNRLRSVVRLNSLGFYTNSEQLCHHGNFTALTGSGLFALASGFNHSCDPSVVRFSLGDITAFVTNRPIRAGEELCISYIESELLSAPKSLRSQSLNRDFTCQCKKCVTESKAPASGLRDDGTKNFMRVDAQVQARLSLLQPQDRVEAVEAALKGQMGDDDEGGEEEEKEVDEVVDAGDESSKGQKAGQPSTVLLGKDAQELRVVQAIALMQMGNREDALKVWRKLAAFTCHHCPPFDEALTVYATQAALAALAVKDDRAADYVSLAVESHRAAFGTDIFKWRYAKEVEESAAPAVAKEKFWRLVRACPGPVSAFSEVIKAWRFAADEVPPAYDVFSA